MELKGITVIDEEWKPLDRYSGISPHIRVDAHVQEQQSRRKSRRQQHDGAYRHEIPYGFRQGSGGRARDFLRSFQGARNRELEPGDRFACSVFAGAVRMPEFSGTFVFEYLSREKTGVVYTYRADPGGGVPLFAANIVGKSMIYRTLSNLRNIAKNRKYFEAGQQSTDRQLFENILSDNQKVRAILKARTSEYCRDEEWIDAAVADDAIFDYFIKGDGMAQQLFASWGSRETVKVTAPCWRSGGNMRWTAGQSKRRNDSAAIIDGKKNGRPFAMEILKSHMLQKQ
jgi:hypothetical protein